MQVELSTENKNSKEEICPKQQAQDSYIDSCNRMAKWTARNENSQKIPLVFSLYCTPIAASLNHHVLPPTFSGNSEVIKLTSLGSWGPSLHHPPSMESRFFCIMGRHKGSIHSVNGWL